MFRGFRKDDGVEASLEDFCEIIGELGFLDEALRVVCERQGKGVYEYQFPEGLASLIWYLERKLDFLLHARSMKLLDQSVSGKVISAVFDRLALYSELANYKILMRGISKLFKQPSNWGLACSSLYHTVDAIWAGVLADKSMDGNFYSKRLILAVVYPACFNHFIADDSPFHSSTKEFIKRKIALVKQIQKIKPRFPPFEFKRPV